MFTVINIIDSFRRTVVECCEVVHKFQRRQRVIVFCQSILNRQNKQICDVVDAQDFSSFNVGEIHLAKDTFEQSFKSVCNENWTGNTFSTYSPRRLTSKVCEVMGRWCQE